MDQINDAVRHMLGERRILHESERDEHGFLRGRYALYYSESAAKVHARLGEHHGTSILTKDGVRVLYTYCHNRHTSDFGYLWPDAKLVGYADDLESVRNVSTDYRRISLTW